MGGRFPALEAFALPAISVLLGLVVLWGLKPWEDDSEAPQRVPLGIEMAVGDAKALSPGSIASVAAGRVVPRGPKLVVQAAKPAAPVERGGETVSSVAVAPAQAIAVAEAPSSPQGSVPGAGAGDEVPSGGATDVEAPPEGTSSPVTVPVSTGAGAGGGTSGGPIASGGAPTPEGCEGDGYLIRVTFFDEEPEEFEEPVGEEAPVEILLQRLGEDGSVEDELKLEGDLADARRLALKFSSEGNCVEVEIAQPDGESQGEEGEGEEEAEDAPEAGEEVTEPVESPEPVSP